MDLDNLKVLVIDHNIDVLELIVCNFKQFGFCIRSSSKLEEAEAFCRREAFSFIVMDSEWEEQEAIQFIKNSQKHSPETPIYLMSKEHSPQNEKLLQHGCEDLYLKHLGESKIKRILKKLILAKQSA